jgi:hypothetical protein
MKIIKKKVVTVVIVTDFLNDKEWMILHFSVADKKRTWAIQLKPTPEIHLQNSS